MAVGQVLEEDTHPHLRIRRTPVGEHHCATDGPRATLGCPVLNGSGWFLDTQVQPVGLFFSLRTLMGPPLMAPTITWSGRPVLRLLTPGEATKMLFSELEPTAPHGVAQGLWKPEVAVCIIFVVSGSSAHLRTWLQGYHTRGAHWNCKGRAGHAVVELWLGHSGWLLSHSLYIPCLRARFTSPSSHDWASCVLAPGPR